MKKEILKDVLNQTVCVGDEVVLLIKERGCLKLTDAYLDRAIYTGKGRYGYEFIDKRNRARWEKNPDCTKQYRLREPECVLIPTTKRL